MKILGVLTIFFLVLAVILSLVLFASKKSRLFVHIGSYTVLVLLLVLSIFCVIIYSNYH